MAVPSPNKSDYSFQSNKIGGPPNTSMDLSDASRQTLPNKKFSLKLLSPNAKKGINLDSSYTFADELAVTPKTRGITRLKKTSSQFTNHEFTKRLSIPSFHVADQILMDLLTEQNNTGMNTIDENEIDDEDNRDIIDFMSDQEDDDDDDEDEDDEDENYEDDEIDSIMTLNAFPDLPDFASAPSNGSVNTLNSTTNLPLSDMGSDDVVINGNDNDNANDSDEEPPQPQSNNLLLKIDEIYDDDEDEDMLTPTTFANLFKKFHQHDMERKEQIDIVVNKAREKENEQQHEETNKVDVGKMKINVSQFKSEEEEEDEEEEESEWDGVGPRGFSGLQHSASLRFTNNIRKSKSYSEESQTIINNDGIGNTHSLRMTVKQKKLSAAESAILVAKELLETEIKYQNHLKNLQQILMHPLQQTYLGNDCISSIFYKFLSDIISVSKSFTMKLQIYVKALQIPQMANWIYFNCKRFGVYAHYSKMYDIFLDRLSLCKDIDDNIEFWIKRQEKKYKQKLKNQKLHSLLMMPIQRLPRYILLLEELIKYTQRIEDGNDIGTQLFLELAKGEITTVSSRVNEMVRQRENRSNLRELVNRFTGNDKLQLLRSNRVLVYEGFLYKVRKYKIKYYFHLFSDILVYSNINNNGLFNIHRIIDLHKIAIVDLSNVDENAKSKAKPKNKKKSQKKASKSKQKIWFRFLLKSQEKSFELLTENEQEKQNWMLLIKAAISRLKNPIHTNIETKPPNTPQSPLSDMTAMFDTTTKTPNTASNGQHTPTITELKDDDDYYAPYWVPNEAANNCCCCNAEFSVLTRRHHCRRCGLLVCGSCSKHKQLLINIDKNKPVRICDNCHHLLSQIPSKPSIPQTTEQPLFTDNSPRGDSSEDSLGMDIGRRLDRRKAFSVDENVQREIRRNKSTTNLNLKINSKTKTKTKKNRKKAKTKTGKKKRLKSVGCNDDLLPQSSMERAHSTPTMSFDDSNSSDRITPKVILKFIRQYKNKLRVLLEHFARPLMDVVENNKIITDFITTKKFYNKSNIIVKQEENQENENHKKPAKNKKKTAKVSKKKNKKKELRNKKRKRALERNKKTTLNALDVKAKTILNNLYKFNCGHKTLISLFTILEQIYDIICLLHSELKLIIFKKHINYEDDMILDFYDDGHLNDADHARIGRLFIMYTDLFNIHVEYASRFPECFHIIIGNRDKNENFLIDFIKDCKLSLINLNAKFILKDLLETPLNFTQQIFEYLTQIDAQIDSSMVNSSDLDLCLKSLKQIISDLNKEKSASQQRIKLYKLESQFDFNIDFRERGRTLVISDFITKTTKHINHNYYFHLFNNVLCYSSKKLGNNKFVLKKYIYLTNMKVIDGVVYDDHNNDNKDNKKNKKKPKKRDLRTITVKYSENNFVFDLEDTNQFNLTQHPIMEEGNEEDDDNDDIVDNNNNDKSKANKKSMKSFCLIFDTKEKKQTWYQLLKNLIEDERSKYKKPEEHNNHTVTPHLRSPSGSHSSMRRYSATIGKEIQFCGICHSSFNRLFNTQYKCLKCDLPICAACCIDKFYLTTAIKKIIAPQHLRLCIRCNFYNDNERSCNIICV